MCRLAIFRRTLAECPVGFYEGNAIGLRQIPGIRPELKMSHGGEVPAKWAILGTRRWVVECQTRARRESPSRKTNLPRPASLAFSRISPEPFLGGSTLCFPAGLPDDDAAAAEHHHTSPPSSETNTRTGCPCFKTLALFKPGQLDHGHLPQGMLPDPGPGESARQDILADAPDSKSGPRKRVWVQVPPSVFTILGDLPRLMNDLIL